MGGTGQTGRALAPPPTCIRVRGFRTLQGTNVNQHSRFAAAWAAPVELLRFESAIRALFQLTKHPFLELHGLVPRGPALRFCPEKTGNLIPPEWKQRRVWEATFVSHEVSRQQLV